MTELKFDKNRKRVKYCPCGKSNGDNKFVPYVGHDKYGYCHSCLEIIKPESNNKDYKRQFYKPKQTDFMQYAEVIRHGRNFRDNNFVQFLKNIWGEEATRSVILAYALGTSDKWSGSTIFWQIDNRNRLRAGKIMLYDSLTGKNVKEPYRHISWMHGEDFNLSQCLYGLHLITEHKPEIIGLVESEKTAIIMALEYPEENVTWMSTGGKGNFRKDMLRPLKDFHVIAYPDKGEYNVWRARASELGFDITVDYTIEKMNVPTGTDWADIILEEKGVLC